MLELTSNKSAMHETLFQAARRHLADMIYPQGREQRDQAERLANIDHLTGLANRRAFDRARETAETDGETCFLLFDANNFGKINKVAGMLAGDSFLRELSSVIRQVAEMYGFGNRCFRIGGDEFVILAPLHSAEALRDQVERSFGFKEISNFVVSVSGTIGRTFDEADATLQERKAEAKA